MGSILDPLFSILAFMTHTRSAQFGRSLPWGVEAASPIWASWTSRCAFILTLVLGIARAMMTETARSAFDVTSQASAGPSGPGATTTLLLNLLCCLPALLVLLRRTLDRNDVLRWTWSQVLLGLLAIWAVISIGWSSDKFIALLSASSTLAAGALVWSTAQLVRNWVRLRIVAGVCLGLLLIYIAQGLIYRFADFPDNVRYWQQHKEEIIQSHGWDANSFEARQFEKKLLSGEMIGFNQSPNSFAAVIVLLMVISAGIAIQRGIGRDGIAWSVLIVASFAPAFVVLYYTGSRTAGGTILIATCALLLLIPRRIRALLRARPGTIYLIGVVVVVIGTAALIGHGIVHGSLPQDSLNFRWRYWVAAFHMWRDHRILGVGWGNFGPNYLAYRLPAAAEEIQDPHNFLVRCFSELGLVGGLLSLGWVARAAWELTRPTLAPQPITPADAKPKRVVSIVPLARGTIATVCGIAIGGIVLNAAVAIDWSQPSAFLLLEVFRRVLALGLLVVGLIAATARGRTDRELDNRPALWVLWALIIGLGVFFIHNLIDFVIAEPGPLTLFAILLGSGLGLRTPVIPARASRRGIAAVWLSMGCVAWIVAVIGVLVPVASAEEQAARADDALRADRPDLAAGLLRNAYEIAPYNADYAYRCAQALMRAGAAPDQILSMLGRAIATDPKSVSYFATRAEFEMTAPHPDPRQVRADYDRTLALDPANVQIRLEYAAALEKLGEPQAAVAQLRQALHWNDLLNPDEPKRLPAARVQSIQQHIAALSRSATKPAG
jgi:O-antigen ligase